MLWNRRVLKGILMNVVYIGHLAQGRVSSDLCSGISHYYIKEENWDIVYNTHEAIISQELWTKVQEFNKKQSKAYKESHGKYDHLPKRNNIYGKTLICADCSRPMKLYRSISKDGKKAYFHYYCPTYLEHGEKGGCTRKKTSQTDLEQLVLEIIKQQMKLFLDKQNVLQLLIKQIEKNSQECNIQEQILHLELLVQKKTNLCTNLYLDLKEGILTKEEYLYTKEKYQSEIIDLQCNLKELKSRRLKRDKILHGEQKWNALIKKYYNAKSLSKEIVEALIEKIELSEDKSIHITFKYADELEELSCEYKLLSQEAI